MADLTQKKFLDQSGVTTLWSRILTKLGDESNGLKDLIDANTAAIGVEKERALAAEKVNADAIAGLQAIVNSILENEDEINLNSIAELAAWITAHGGEAEALTQAIEALEAKTVLGVDAEGNEYATVKAYVEAAVAAVTSGDVTELKNRVKALEDAGYQNAEQVGSAIDAKISALDLANTYDAKGAAQTAEDNAKAYADGLAGNYDAAGSAQTAEDNAKAYADSLADNYDAAGAAATAEGNAKAYAKDYTDGAVEHVKVGLIAPIEASVANITAAMPVALSTEEIDAAIEAATPKVSE